MPADKFICPNNDQVLISMCLNNCHHASRCMSKPTLEALATSVADRDLKKFSVTELLKGTREAYLMKTNDYAVDPFSLFFALHGTAIHHVSEVCTDDEIVTELRMENDICTGKIDAYGNDIITRGKHSLIDFKVVGSYKAMLALGYQKNMVSTGEVYKTGIRKGQPKYKAVWNRNGRRDVFEYALQLNMYRLMLEEEGHRVDDMYIQLFIRDYSLKTAAERNISKPVYLIKINKISDHWLKLWFKAKKERLEQAIATGEIPARCNHRESWSGRKCSDYCAVADICKAEEAKIKEAALNAA